MTELIERPIEQTAGVHIPVQREPASRRQEIHGGMIDLMIDMEPAGLVWRRTFHGTPDQVPHARHFVRFLLADDSCRADAELIVTELAGNAIRHTSSGQAHGTFIAEVARTVATVTVAVYDCGWGGIPRFTTRRTLNERGRGLVIVRDLADAVGYEGDDQVGHKVWARLARS